MSVYTDFVKAGGQPTSKPQIGADLEALTTKARASDAYHAAARKMSARQAEVQLSLLRAQDIGDELRAAHLAGWLQCLREYAKYVVDASTEDQASAEPVQ